MNEEFYAVIKLISGEEIFAKVVPCEEENRTLLLLDNPVIFENILIKHLGVGAVKIEPWLTVSNDSIIVIDMDKVITISEVYDDQYISVYTKYLRDKDRDSNQTEVNPNMGFLSSVSDARVFLEKLYKSSMFHSNEPDRVILQMIYTLVIFLLILCYNINTIIGES